MAISLTQNHPDGAAMAPRPLEPRDIPNLITVLRILLVVPFLWLLLEERYGPALALFVIAGLSDALDGFLAKYYGWTSELGGLLDPLADKLLLLGAILALGWLDELPVWLVALVIGRDLVIVSGALAYHLLVERVQAAPLMISKLNTLTQLVLVCAIIIHYGLIPLPEAGLDVLIYLTALTTVWSGAAYVWRWGWLAWRKGRRSPAGSSPNGV
jgi:cardiolipin synthase (CMP-forming)